MFFKRQSLLVIYLNPEITNRGGLLINNIKMVFSNVLKMVRFLWGRACNGAAKVCGDMRHVQHIQN